MKKRPIIFLTILSILFSLSQSPASAAVKAGGACSKAGVTSVVSSKTYTCVKSGKKLVWNKGAATAKSVDQFVDQVPPTTFICKNDDLAPVAWKSYQNYLKFRNGACDMNFYRFVPYESSVYS